MVTQDEEAPTVQEVRLIATQNEEAPTVAAVRASVDSTLSKGIRIMQKVITGAHTRLLGVPTSSPDDTHPATNQAVCAATIGAMSDCAQSLLGLLERLGQTRDAIDAERIWLQCSCLAGAAWRLWIGARGEELA